MKKIKLLTISDSPLFPSGVGSQARYLFQGLMDSGDYSMCSLAGAIRHQDYRPILIDKDKYQNDWIVFNVDGYGDVNLIRQFMDSEKPDALFLITDPRFFEFLWHIEDEIRPRAAIIYWHLWDNYPIPKFNKQFYDSCNHIGCINEQTMDFISGSGTETPHTYIPHAIPEEFMCPMERALIDQNRKKIFANNENKCIFMYVGRNARRKRTSDILAAFKLLTNKYNDVFLYMHTLPNDHEGADLIEVSKMLGLVGNIHVSFMGQQVNLVGMKDLYNAVDCTVNMSSAEGFGLPILESMLCGTRVIAAHTGGLKDQILHPDLGSYVSIDAKNLSGTQTIPYIFDDYCSIEGMTEKMEETYLLWKKLGRYGLKDLVINKIPLLREKFSYKDLIKRWDFVIKETVKNHKEGLANKKIFMYNI